jgi:gas vesicle protein
VSDVKESVSGVAERASELKDRVGDIGGQARWQTRRLRTNLEHTAEENPLMLAVGAAVVGLALGMLLPGTQREDEIMGSARDQLVDRAEETVERAKEAAVEAGREVKETVKSEFEQHKPELKEVVQQAGENVKEQVKESARRVKSEAKDAAKKSGNSPRSNS